MIEGKNISFAVGDKQILDQVSIHIAAGEVLAICGPNGAGKSTLLRMLSGESKPQTGSIIFKGKEIDKWKPSKLACTRAVLHQESYLTFPFQVKEVVQLGRFPYKNNGHDEEVIKMCLQKVGMWELRKRKYTTLSGGEKQRVHLARILAQLEDSTNTEKILMLDEPTSALDIQHQESTLGVATSYAKENNHCVVLVLHDLNQAAAWADRIVFLKDGRAVVEGPPLEVLTPQIIQEIYGLHAHVLKHPDTNRPLVVISRNSNPDTHTTV